MGLAASCGASAPPSWQALAPRYAAPKERGPHDWVEAIDGSRRLRRRPAPGGASWIEADLFEGDWRRAQLPGLFWTPILLEGAVGTFAGTPFELEVDGTPVRYVSPGEVETNLGNEHAFSVIATRLYFWAGAHAAPPPSATFATYASRGARVDDTWRVSLDEYTADGLPVWPGESFRTTLAPHDDLRLSFSTLAQGDPRIAADSEHSVDFVVRAQGEVIFRHTQVLGAATTHAVHSVELPETGTPRELEFAVEGNGVLTAFLQARLGPAEVGGYDRRPWGEDRPDLVLFVADTFRADNLAVYGGREELTPNLDRLASEATLFERAWSPSSWTLPSQASMMSALFPRQHLATDAAHGMAPELVCIAEELRAAGYRTGAVTDQGWVASAVGMDQGFEWFREKWSTLEATGASIEDFLAADDGRPFFLFVQTYHTHTPFRVSDETRASHGERFDFVEDFPAFYESLGDIDREWTFAGPLNAERRRALELYRHSYWGTVVDLDRSVGEWLTLDGLRQLPEHGALLFTSDHGEGFYEHEVLGHGCGLWEEHVRIPLFVLGKGVTKRRVPHAATLVDVPPTLSFLAGLPPDATWKGRSLLELDEERTTVLFECNNRRQPKDAIAVHHGPLKLLADEPNPDSFRGTWSELALRHAYDLEQDPQERTPLAPTAIERWFEGRSPLPGSLFRAAHDPSASRLSTRHLEQLGELGY